MSPRRSAAAVTFILSLLLLLSLLLSIGNNGCSAHSDRTTPSQTSLDRCNATADGREVVCRGAGFDTIYGPLGSATLSHSVNLTKIDLSNNNITNIPAFAFHQLSTLQVLSFRRNHLVSISIDAFVNSTNLKVLELDDNLLTEIPRAIVQLQNLEDLSITNNRIQRIESGLLQHLGNLESLDLRGNPIKEIHPGSFQELKKLRKLILSNVRDLKEFPNLNGTGALELLRLDRARLKEVPAGLCQTCPKLKSLDLKSNYLTRIPTLTECSDLRVLDLTSNMISSLSGQPFRNLSALHDLLLSNNNLRSLPGDGFDGLFKLQVLNLESNYIEYIHPDTFRENKHLEDLNLGNNVFPTLPTAGLSQLLHLKTFNNPALKEFPAPEMFPRVQTMVLSYAYHCCAFLTMELDEPVTKSPVEESVLFPTNNKFDMSLWNSSLTDIWPQLHNLSNKFGTEINELWDNFGSDFTYPGNLPAYVEDYFEDQEGRSTIPSHLAPLHIQCLPQPGPFLPCQDLFDWWTLRCGVWIVFLLAMLGNGTVVFVLIFSRSKMDVPRFLVCNLAAADFFMGVYLGLLAVIDASTLGEFRMYAIRWQMSAGCQLAGFLGVLSSELSVYTLAVITLERNYAITHAMHLNKRLSLKHAGYIMTVGWGFALSMATLPLLGVSDYRKFAICLPFETTGTVSLTYVVFLMLINGVAFLILMGCYLKMYCAIRGSQAWNSNDSRIAKRMALLVFTDFLCWSPIAFFSLTATFGLQLVSLEQAKVFAVFVLPLNSCCNPFLYAILTKQFKKDCVLICKAIEESRVTRGIGRCRHSSNFSNRQTPANTNSLVDRSSRENQAPCVCNTRLLEASQCRSNWWGTRWLWPCTRSQHQRHARSDQYAYQIAEIQQKQHKRASSVSSSENFSSSRSDSWRQTHHCGIPLRLLDPKRRASSWLITRKPSQDSNLSSSRNDSSGSATTASTSTWRMSRSSASLDVTARPAPRPVRPKPRLTRQLAVQEPDPPASPGRLAVRLLATIPSAAEMSEQQDDEGVLGN
ncbi:lutropin-choriogonadotropic hormone receptor isoform X1 [Diprion similis]|uniref:lutropin-choriogonadotropic hormone receptor isoform X1 n=1 Tax=Diprion similis TaxID=362088 RepID=UPI001EF84BF3|nr:lutropin-choriogonadotropic hormone receptor isoform X1 [Diprion similis]